MSFFQEVRFDDRDELPVVKKKLRLLVEEMVRLSKKQGGSSSFTGTIAATDVTYSGGTTVQAALDALDAVDASLQAQINSIIAGGAVDWDNVENKPGTFPPSAHTHPASEISYVNTTSGLTAVIVQDAIDELRVLVGTGGIGALDDIPDVNAPAPNDGDVLTRSAGEWISSPPSGSYTDENAQDAVGSILANSSTVTLTYLDGTPSITAAVPDGAITYAKMQDVSAASRLLGRGSAGGSGDVEEVTLGSGLTMTGTVLSASGGGGSANITPDTHPSSPSVADDEGEVGTSIDTAGTRTGGATPWVWYNQGTATALYANGSIVLNIPNSAGVNLRMLGQAVPVGTYRYRAKVAALIPQGNFCRVGLYVGRTAASKVLAIDSAYSGGAKIEANSWNYTSYIGGIGTSLAFPGLDSYDSVYLEIEYDGSSIYTFRWSRTGVDGAFVTHGTQAQATNLGGAADVIGIYANVENSVGITIGIFDWFRRMA